MSNDLKNAIKDILAQVERRALSKEAALARIKELRDGTAKLESGLLYFRETAVSLDRATTNAGSHQHGPVLALGGSSRQMEALKAVCGDNLVIWAQPDASFTRYDARSFSLRIGRKEDFERLFKALEESGSMPSRVAHFGSSQPFSTDHSQVAEQLRHGPQATLLLIQALLARKKKSLSRYLYLFESDSSAEPVHRAVAGLLKEAGLEHPHFVGRTARLTSGQPKALEQAIQAGLWSESPASVEMEAENDLLRGRGIERIFPSHRNGAAILPEGGVCLITGGAGGLGFLFAEHLAQRCRARVALLGRSEISDALRSRMRQIEALGGEARYIRADAGNLAELEAAVAETNSAFGPIQAVIHAAGVMPYGRVADISFDALDKVWRSKIFGTLHLDSATRGQPLAWMALFSSISSVIGVAEACGYASGNAFMDEFAVWRNQQGAAGQRQGRAISFNWPWWEEGGMQIEGGAAAQWKDWMWSSQGMRPLTREKGLQAFEEGIQSGESRVIVADGDAARAQETLRRGLGWRTVPASTEPALAKKPEIKAPRAAAPRDQLLAALKSQVSELLNVPLAEIDTRAGLTEFGFDSISLKSLAERLNEQFSLDLMPSIFFSHSTLNALADHLLATHPQAFAPATKEEPPPAVAVEREAVEKQGAGAEDEPIVIVGLSGLLPGSKNLDEFWEHLWRGDDLITEIPPSRWNAEIAFQSGEAGEGKTNSKWGGFIADVDKFDARFFGIPPWEAERMDPQHRLLLEAAWNCLENAGESADSISGKPVGVFVGIQFHEYQDLLAFEGDLHMYNATGNGHAMIANRLSYFLNLRGPSEAIDTACSSSLVALNRAVSAIRGGECEAALVGGVSLILCPGTLVVTSQMGILSPDGRCKVFDASANGYVKGEGVLSVYLMPLSRAKQGGYPIHGIIRGIGVNHGGKASSLTAPNAQAQSELIVSTFRRAGVAPETVACIEAHGTGTELGDPVEVDGLKSAFAALSGKTEWAAPVCGIGSVKSNIGHLEPAAGLAGVVKMLLAMRHKRLPASLHVKQLNPYLRLEKSPFFILDARREWTPFQDAQGKPMPRRAGVSSFGFGGANAHVILEEYIPETAAAKVQSANREAVIVLSAKSEGALRQRIADLHHWAAQTDVSLENLAATLQMGRAHLPHRCALTVKSVEALRHLLGQIVAEESPDGVLFGKAVESAEAVIDAGRATAVALVEAFVQGRGIHWETLYESRSFQRLILPGYPFEKVSHWYQKREKPVAPEAKNPSATAPSAAPLKLKGLTQPPPESLNRSAASQPRVVLKQNLPASAKPASSAVEQASPNVSMENVARKISEIVATALYLDNEPPDEEKTFVDLGSDSILGVQIIRQVNEAFAVNLPASKLYDQPTIRKLAEHVAGLIRATEKISGSAPARAVEPSPKAGPARASNARVIEEIKATVAAALYLEQSELDCEKSFAELGADSILGVEIIRRVNSAFRLNMPASKLYEHSTITALSAYVGGLLGESVAEPERHAQAPATKPPATALKESQEALGRPPGASVTAGRSEKGLARPKVVVSRSGSVDDLEFAEAEQRPLLGNEIEVEVRAASVILPDLLCARGLYPTMPAYPFTPGFEFAGVITRAGSEARLHQAGDRVFGVTGDHLGGHSAMLIVREDLAVAIPDSLTFTDAATIPEAFLTACFALIEIGRLAEGERVLIHSAASGTGLAAIQLAQQRKARIFATVGSDEKAAYLRSLGVKDVVNYREGDFEAFVREVIGPQGVDLALNLLSGPMREAALRALAPFGRFLDIAVGALKASGQTDLSSMILNQSYHSIDCRRIYQRDPGCIQRILRRLTAMLEAGEIKPLKINRMFAFEEARDAYAWVEQRQGIGKTLLCRNVSRSEKKPAAASGAIAPGSLEIAVIGMAGRFPGAKNIDEFWSLLSEGRCAIREIPPERWSIAEHYDPDPKKTGKSYSKWGGFLEGIDQFDPLFFNISPAEAEQMDPQQRLFLETAWHALENAGYATSSISGAKCGVFVGVGQGDYVEAAREAGGGFSAPLLMGSSCSMVGSRFAYFLNLTGPSVAVDTACSSSLTAIYQACQSLLAGDSDLAIAGGVCVMTTPAMYIMMSKAGMLSPEGLCKTFDQTADGFVPGEGVGLIVLKRLAQAVRDGDHIYGVIKGGGTNQDGATNGITAPNPAAQKALEASVYRRIGIHPETIGYVETHGTGTKLGDPIEIDAISEAFREFTPGQQFCAIGSVKTNIGHTLSTAGAASVIKTLLCLQHGKLVPSLHYRQRNEHIDLDSSPFYVNTALRDWPAAGAGPRRAAVSSFGFSGTNVHLVMEEAPAAPPAAAKPGVPHLLTISARTEESLRQRLDDLAGWLGLAASDTVLEYVSFTLNAGRTHFRKRCAVVAASVVELQEALRKAQTSEAPKLDSTAQSALNEKARNLSRRMAESFSSLESRREILLELGVLYQQGAVVDWEGMYSGEAKRRIPLPGYPFKRKRYWAVPSPASASVQPAAAAMDGASWKILPTDWLVKDHVVRGVKTLPGTAILEGARAAVAAAFPGRSVASLHHVVFLHPAQADEAGLTLTTRASRKASGRAAFETRGAQGILHAQGEADFAAATAASREQISIEEQRKKFADVFSSEAIYTHFHSAGLDYGPAFKGLNWLAAGEEEAFGQIDLSGATGTEFEWHPALLDAALQTVAAWSLSGRMKMPLAVPFEIREILFFAPLPKNCFVRARRQGESAGIYRWDVQIFDASGAEICRVNGFALKAPGESLQRSGVTQLFRPVWISAPVLRDPAKINEPLLLFDNDDARAQAVCQWRANTIQVKSGGSFRKVADNVYAIRPGEAEDCERLLAALAERGFATRDVLQLWPMSGTLEADSLLRDGFFTDFALAKAASAKGISELRVIHAFRGPFGGMMAGWAKSLAQERRGFQWTVVDGSAASDASLPLMVLSELANATAQEIRLEGTNRWARGFEEHSSKSTGVDVIRPKGVYLITGGLGGLGRLFAEHLVKDFSGRVALMGRSEPTSAQQAWLDALNSGAGKALCLRGDISSLADTARVVAAVEKEFGALHGVIHAAGVLRDSRLAVKAEEDAAAVLSPKARGAIHLDAATRHLPLDFFALFSSVAGSLGNVGQTDYGAANAFLDRFAEWRETQRVAGNRRGKSVSINWPWWKEGGMQLGAATQGWMRTTWGLEGLETRDGLAAFHQALASASPQIMVLCGEERRWKEITQRQQSAAPAAKAASGSADPLSVRRAVIREMAKQLKVEEGEIDQDEDFSAYGFDSISLTEFSNRLNEVFQIETTPAFFFEHASAAALSDFLAKTWPERFAPVVEAAPEPMQTAASSPPALPSNPPEEREGPTEAAHLRDAIAVIAMDGRFPGAANLEEFWRNLEQGKDCIGEVPPDRWDWRKLPEELRRAKWGGFIDGIDLFDASLFGISRREAELMDPQQRLFLETAWTLLEKAGYPSNPSRPSAIGLFVGVSTSDYAELLAGDVVTEAHSPTGLSHCILVNRVSHLLNLTGPSEAVNTACSSSLVALHRAVRSLREGECEMAVAAGVGAIITPTTTLGFLRSGMLSADGRCKTFDEKADGYVRGEGVGAVLLKRYSDARRDGDRIHGLILGSAVNHGGRTNTLTAPNPAAQAEAVLAACRDAKISPLSLSYIEAHGTGTALGDPVEVNGLKRAFASVEGAPAACGLGTVKSNIGHLEAAAGIAGVIKVLLALERQKLPASLHVQRLNAYIRLEGSPFYIVRETQPWQRPRDLSGNEIPRRAGVSSFGFGGANAHVTLEEAPLQAQNQSSSALKPLYLAAFSARDQKALSAKARDLAAWLRADGSQHQLEDVCYTLNAGRHHLARRCVILAASKEELLSHLAAMTSGEPDNQRVMVGDRIRMKPEDEAVFKAVWESTANSLDWRNPGAYREKLRTLAGLHIKGFAIDWNILHTGESRQRLALPTYPFQRERYWVPAAPVVKASVARLEAVSAPEVEILAEAPLRDKVAGWLSAEAANLLKISEQEINWNENLSEFGFDSYNFKTLAEHLNAQFGLNLQPSVFFSYTSIGEVADYLCESCGEVVASHFGEMKTAGSAAAAQSAPKAQAPTAALAGDGAVAIVGMSGIFPGSPDLEAFWKNLEAGRDLVSEVPPERWDWRTTYDRSGTARDKTNSKWGGFIDDPDCFDAEFFGISPREAEMMDPQQRLFLQTAWKAVESAGQAPEALSGQAVGVFLGIQFNDYQELLAARGISDAYGGTGNAHSIAANRISYLLNLTGPSETVDTACSSSLVALNRAVQSLRQGECDSALAGGANLMLSPSAFVATSQLGALSPDGRCKTFDAAANGYVRGEGVGAVYLMRLPDAERLGHPILGVIKGSAVNHGGKAQSLTAPSARAQASLIARACRQAGAEPGSISFIEAHGTGTELGDPIEIEGLKAAFAELGLEKAEQPFCGIASVKSNIGHLEAAAGIAGVIKTLLALKHGVLPASLHVSKINPYIQLEGTPFYLVTATPPWRQSVSASGELQPRRAGVSSFGFGGANAHVLIEERLEPGEAAAQERMAEHVFPLSARSVEALRRRASDLAQWMSSEGSGQPLSSIAHTLGAGRGHYSFRASTVAGSAEELRGFLSRVTSGEDAPRKTGAVETSGKATRRAQEIIAELGKDIRGNSRRERLRELAELYLTGAVVDWAALSDGAARRIMLPTYPFAKTRFWLPAAAAPAAHSPEIKPPSALGSLEDSFCLGLLSDMEEGRIGVNEVVNELKQS